MTTRSKHAMAASLALATAAALSAPALGTTYVWTRLGGSNNWDVAGNWTSPDGGTPPPPLTPTAPDVTHLVFSGAPPSASSTMRGGDYTIESIRFEADLQTVAGTTTFALSTNSATSAALFLGAGGITNLASPTINFNTGSSADRRTILTADQTWLTNGTMTMNRPIEGPFRITKMGVGSLLLTNNNGGFSGGITISEGIVRVQNQPNAFGTGPLVSIADANTGLTASGTTQVDQVLVGPVTLGGAGTFSFGGSWNFTLDGAVTLTTDKHVAIGAGSIGRSLVFNQPIGGAGRLIKLGDGTMVFNGANTHAGTTVGEGVLILASDAQLGTAGAALGLGDAAALMPATLRPTVAFVSPRDLALAGLGGRIDTSLAGSAAFGNADGVGVLGKLGDGPLAISRVRATGLDIQAGVVNIAPNGGDAATSVVKTLTLAPGTALDVADNDLVVDYDLPPAETSPEYDAVKAAIVAGYAAGAWNGSGIRSVSANAATNGLGYAEASALGVTSFSGQTVDDTAVLVKFTFYGDTNLDGAVDVTDLGNLASGWQQPGDWIAGDFNYDGVVDVADLGALATNWQAGVTGPASADASLHAALTSAGLSVVPEPLGLSLTALGALALRRRRA